MEFSGPSSKVAAGIAKVVRKVPHRYRFGAGVKGGAMGPSSVGQSKRKEKQMGIGFEFTDW